jgi:NAD(P)-dependent dehydrogenase (short-subunit alcohol dehydrogenase family)
VIGGCTGIGAEVVSQLRGKGASVECTSSRTVTSTQARFQLELSSPTSCELFVSAMRESAPPPRVIVFCAATATADELSDKEAMRVLQINFLSVRHIALALDDLVRVHGTRFVFVSTRKAECVKFWPFDDVSDQDEDNADVRFAMTYAQSFSDDNETFATHNVCTYTPQFYLMSKLLLNRFVRRLSQRHNSGRIVCCCPGECKTVLSGHDCQRSATDGAIIVSWLAQEEQLPQGVFFDCEYSVGSLEIW